MFFYLNLLFLLLFFQERELREFKIHGFAQGTSYSVSYYAADSVVTKRSIDSILMKIDSSMSLYKPYSLINRFNSGSNEIVLDEHFLKVVQKSFIISKETKGIFDITIKPLVHAWGFGAKRIEALPDSAQIKKMLGCVGMDNIQLNGNKLLKKAACTELDVNGIAQGYTVDVLADFVNKKGASSYVVELGGELRVTGPKPDGKPTRIGIEGPVPGHSEAGIRHVISFNQGAITTSGNYRKYVESNGKKITHLINPRTGYPSENELISVTVYADDAITADGYDNAIMTMGLENGLRFVSSTKNIEAYIIYKQKGGFVADTMTRGFRKMVVQNKLTLQN